MALIFCAVPIVYAPGLRGGMLWDDSAHVTSPPLRTLDGLRRIWFELGATQQYYPLTHSAFWLEHNLWGDAVLGYHLVNILTHCANAVLVGLILMRLGAPGATLAAIVFALHPVHVESVAWISEQKNTLSALLYLSAAMMYLRFDRERRSGAYAAALALFVMSLLTKSVTSTLPAALLVIFWWQRGRLDWRRDIVPLIPWLVIGLASGLFTAWIERHFIGADGPLIEFSPLQRCIVAGRAIWFYLGKLIWPAKLVFIYPRWEIAPASILQYRYSLAFIVLALALWGMRRRTRAPLAALLFFVGSLFPALGFFNIYSFVYSFVADHFQYLASIGVIALAAGAAATTLRSLPLGNARIVGRAGCAAVVAVLAMLTFNQSRMYRDAKTLYRTTVQRNPSCWMAYNNLGSLLLGEGNASDAVDVYERAIPITPTAVPRASVYTNLGRALLRLERRDQAAQALGAALSLAPDYPDAHDAMGALLFAEGRTTDALAEFEQSIHLNPRLPEAHNDLGLALAKLKRFDQAIEQYKQAIALQPALARAHRNLADALAETGKLQEAIAQYRQALEIEPESAQTHNGLGGALAATGRPRDALEHFNRALQLKPDDPVVCNNLAWFFLTCPDAQLRNVPEALRLAKRSVALTHEKDPSMLDTLAAAYAQTGELSDAITAGEKALELARSSSDAALVKEISKRLELYRGRVRNPP